MTEGSRQMAGFAVGTALSGRPPHGAVREGFPHTALTSGAWRRALSSLAPCRFIPALSVNLLFSPIPLFSLWVAWQSRGSRALSCRAAGRSTHPSQAYESVAAIAAPIPLRGSGRAGSARGFCGRRAGVGQAGRLALRRGARGGFGDDDEDEDECGERRRPLSNTQCSMTNGPASNRTGRGACVPTEDRRVENEESRKLASCVKTPTPGCAGENGENGENA